MMNLLEKMMVGMVREGKSAVPLYLRPKGESLGRVFGKSENFVV
jgi:hypothetical protein